MPITDRAYRDDADRDGILRFLSGANAAEAPNSRYWHPGDVVWAMYQNTTFDPCANFHLWEEAGDLVGIGWFEEPDDFIFALHPRLLGEDALAEAVLAWGIDQAREHGAGSPRVHMRSLFPELLALLHRHGFESDTRTPARLVERRGYAPDGYSMVHFQRGLHVSLPEPELPSGWTVRPVGGEDEWPARVEIHRAVWAPSRVTLEAYRRLRAAPVYRPELDLIAVAPDGRFAAYCICWFDPVTLVAEFEPVGTSPDFQGRGVGRLLLMEAFKRLRAAGAQTAIVLTSTNNTRATHLYTSAGFAVTDTEYMYTRA